MTQPTDAAVPPVELARSGLSGWRSVAKMLIDLADEAPPGISGLHARDGVGVLVHEEFSAFVTVEDGAGWDGGYSVQVLHNGRTLRRSAGLGRVLQVFSELLAMHGLHKDEVWASPEAAAAALVEES